VTSSVIAPADTWHQP